MYKHVNGLSELMVAYVPALKPQAPHAISTLGCQPNLASLLSTASVPRFKPLPPSLSLPVLRTNWPQLLH